MWVPLVERAEEIARLEGALDRARSGSGVTVIVEGPAGIGKTSLLRYARARAADLAMTVLHARGSQLEHDFGMGIVRQCFEPVLRFDPARDELLEGAARLAESAVLELPDSPEPAPVGILHGLYWLTANLAGRSPVLLVLDDAHWADASSLLFLAYLARRVESLPVALMLGMRSDEAQTRGASLSEIRVDPATKIIEPRPLPPSAVAVYLGQVAAGVVDETFARACHAATGGNPFLLGELARALRDEGVPFTADGASRIEEVTPPTVARSVSATLQLLGDDTRELARAVATLGDGVELELAAELAGLEVGAAAARAADLVRARILDDTAELHFRHPLLRGAVRADHPARARAQAHAHAAALLRSRRADPEGIALQLAHSPPAGDPQAVADLRAGADRARARGAPATSVSLLRRALAEPPAPKVRAELLLELGRAEYATGDPAAERHLKEAHGAATDPVTRGHALVFLMQTGAWGNIGGMRGLRPAIKPTIGEVEPLDRELALQLRAAMLSLPGEEPDEWRAAVQYASGLTGSTPGEALLLSSLAFILTWTGSSASEVAELAARATLLADAALEEGSLGVLVTGIVLVLRWTDRLDDALRFLDRAVASARRRGSDTDYSMALSHRGAVHRRAGRLREAETDARLALAAAADSGSFHLGHGFATLVGSLIDQGRLDEAAVAVAQVPEGDGRSPTHIHFLLERMRLHAARGEYRRGLADWGEASSRALWLGRGLSPAWVDDLVIAAELQDAAGDAEAVRVLLDEATEFARNWGTPAAVGRVLRATAELGLTEKRTAALREAVARLRESPARLELARALLALGSTLRRAGQRVESREPLREGYELARLCGAEALADTARGELRASGIRLRRVALTGVDALTGSERRIAELAAGGASNAQIAQSLFLTVKTVEMHLTRAYRKLDIRGRGELPAALRNL